ncbi:MAG: ferritin [Anaerolineales bacterium]
MLISKELESAMDAQIGREFGASMQYVNIATYFDSDNLPQLAAFFYRQAEEEKMHAMKFVHYIVEAGGQVRVPAIEEAKYDFQSPKEAVQAALDWEVEVTKQINNLMDLAIKQNDHIGQDFLRWFVTEQLEEVSTMDTLLSVVERAGDNVLWVEDFLARNPVVPADPQAA